MKLEKNVIPTGTLYHSLKCGRIITKAVQSLLQLTVKGQNLLRMWSCSSLHVHFYPAQSYLQIFVLCVEI